MFDVQNELLEKGLEFEGVSYSVIDTLEKGFLLCVKTAELEAGIMPLQTYILIHPSFKESKNHD